MKLRYNYCNKDFTGGNLRMPNMVKVGAFNSIELVTQYEEPTSQYDGPLVWRGKEQLIEAKYWRIELKYSMN